MASQQEMTVQFKTDEGVTRQGTLFYTAYTPSDRTRRAIIALVVCWLLAVASIPIILAHYILIPAFLIAGPVMARSRFKQQDSKEKVEGECPHHNGPFTLKLETTDVLPKWVYCPECDKGLQILEMENKNETSSEVTDTVAIEQPNGQKNTT